MTELVPAADQRISELQGVLALEGAGAITATSLDLTDPDMPFDRWEACGRMFGQIERSNRWWIGDWLLFGEAVYGEDSAQAVDDKQSRTKAAEQVTGLDPATLANIASICRKVDRDHRKRELGFWIHAEVTALDPDEQTLWLERAIEQGWTRSELRAAIREAKRPPNEDGSSPPEPERMTVCERQSEAWSAAYSQHSIATDGSAVIPAEAWAQVTAALGQE